MVVTHGDAAAIRPLKRAGGKASLCLKAWAQRVGSCGESSGLGGRDAALSLSPGGQPEARASEALWGEGRHPPVPRLSVRARCFLPRLPRAGRGEVGPRTSALTAANLHLRIANGRRQLSSPPTVTSGFRAAVRVLSPTASSQQRWCRIRYLRVLRQRLSRICH